MKGEWIPFDPKEELPPERRLVLVRARDERRNDTVIVVGFLITIGSVGPFFVCPGLEGTGLCRHTHWCDCLGNDFEAPHWVDEGTLLTQSSLRG